MMAGQGLILQRQIIYYLTHNFHITHPTKGSSTLKQIVKFNISCIVLSPVAYIMEVPIGCAKMNGRDRGGEETKKMGYEVGEKGGSVRSQNTSDF